jgi:hypothetical protein
MQETEMPRTNNETLEIVTCSYRPDLERCRRLCESVDRHVPAAIGQVLVVPRRDLPAFQPLASPRRRIVPVEDVLPRRFYQVPLSNRFWTDGSGWPVRGWILQQLVKLSANYITDAELILFADSDLQFVRDFDVSHVYRNGQLRLHRVPGAMNEGRHRGWHKRAATLMGVQADYFGSDYVGQLITWRRSQLSELQEHISRVQRKPWHVAVARSYDISEYILYGSFVEHVVGGEAAGHYFEDQDLCHCCWFMEQADGLLQGRESLAPASVALLIQSNLGLSTAEEAAILRTASGSVGNQLIGA